MITFESVLTIDTLISGSTKAMGVLIFASPFTKRSDLTFWSTNTVSSQTILIFSSVFLIAFETARAKLTLAAQDGSIVPSSTSNTKNKIKVLFSIQLDTTFGLKTCYGFTRKSNRFSIPDVKFTIQIQTMLLTRTITKIQKFSSRTSFYAVSPSIPFLKAMLTICFSSKFPRTATSFNTLKTTRSTISAF